MEQPNQQPTQEKTESKPSTKTNWKFLVIVVVLGLVVGVGTMWYINSLRAEPQTPQTITPRPTPLLTETEVDTSTWQTYRNSEFGFEVKYPPILELQKNVQCRANVSFEKEFKHNEGVMLHHTFGPSTRSTNVTDLLVLICEFEENYKALANYYSGGLSTTVFDRQAYKIEYGAEESAGEIYYTKKSEDITLMIQFDFMREEFGGRDLLESVGYINFSRQKQIADQILSTFRFVPTP